MMQRSTGGEQLQAFEGLVYSTARMFASQVRREEDDLAQELRVVVWRAVKAYNPERSSLDIKRFVFGAVTNKIRDYKRDAAREANRRERYGLTFLHIEDMRLAAGADVHDDRDQQEAFDGRFNFVAREEVYREIDEGRFVFPASVTETEANVLLLLMMELSKPEIVLRLGISRALLDACVVALRAKFADWRPDPQRQDSSRVVSVELVIAA